jgi:hypothetical protein
VGAVGHHLAAACLAPSVLPVSIDIIAVDRRADGVNIVRLALAAITLVGAVGHPLESASNAAVGNTQVKVTAWAVLCH